MDLRAPAITIPLGLKKLRKSSADMKALQKIIELS